MLVRMAEIMFESKIIFGTRFIMDFPIILPENRMEHMIYIVIEFFGR